MQKNLFENFKVAYSTAFFCLYIDFPQKITLLWITNGYLLNAKKMKPLTMIVTLLDLMLHVCHASKRRY